jgi:hypothetical protein
MRKEESLWCYGLDVSGTEIYPIEDYINIYCIMQNTGYTTLRNEFLGE